MSSLYPPIKVGGAELVVHDLARGMVERGERCAVITLTDAPATVRQEEDGVDVWRIPLKNAYWPFDGAERGAAARATWHVADSWNPLMARAVGKALDVIGPRVVNSHNISGFSAAIWRTVTQRDIPLVHTLHDQYLLCPRTTMFRGEANCARQCRDCRLLTVPRRAVMDRPALVTGPSQFIIDRHRQHGWFTGTTGIVVANSVRSPRIQVPERSTQTFTFGYLGRIAATKGVEALVRAYLDVERADAQLVIGGVGEPSLERRLRDHTRNRRDIRWLGFVDPDEFLSGIDVLVVPSIWDDTAPLVVMEAFQHGVPVIGSNRGGIPELVGEGAGWVIDPADHAGFVERLRRCVIERDHMTSMAAAARRAAAERTPARMVEDYLDVYGRSG